MRKIWTLDDRAGLLAPTRIVYSLQKIEPRAERPKIQIAIATLPPPYR